MKKIIFAATLLAAGTLFAQVSDEVSRDFDSLGDNRIILEKAKALSPEKEISIVQNRLVSRRQRVEIAPEFGGTFGGDTYTKSQTLGLNVHYHFNPKISVGVRHAYFFNQMTSEGKSLFDRAYQDYLENSDLPSMQVPDIDFGKSESMVLLNWYPVYGKMNVFDKLITQFDLYAVLGYGQIEMSSGSKPTYTIGGGFGFWHTQKISSRIEMRYQNYKAEYYTGEKSLNLAIASVQVGWLL